MDPGHGAGGVGSMAIQTVKMMGGIPVAVISDESKRDYCLKLGAAFCINRSRFSHWKLPLHAGDSKILDHWLSEARSFGKAIREGLGEKRDPQIVIEHSGVDTLATSLFVCAPNGMVVTVGATSGFVAPIDLRYLWMRQKRLQGSHFASRAQAEEFNRWVIEGKIDPCVGKVFDFDQVGLAHQLIHENRAPCGKSIIKIGC